MHYLCNHNFKYMRKNIFILLITSFLCLEGVAQSATKNSLEFGFQFYGLPIPDMELPMGAMFKIGYDIVPYKKNLRSEEHTSELQSRQYLVCRLLLEKKKKRKNNK